MFLYQKHFRRSLDKWNMLWSGTRFARAGGSLPVHASWGRLPNLRGYLTYKKTPPPRTLQ